MSLASALAVFLGAGLGALLRWALGLWLNPLWLLLPLGTLTANLLGGALIGMAMAFFPSSLAAEWFGEGAVVLRLAAVTGFLGGLTTFSTYSAEVMDPLLRGLWAQALVIALTHLLGSLLLTGLGYWVVRVMLPAPV